VLALVVVGTFMTALDEWVIIAYLVVIAGTLLTFGRLSDLVGRKPSSD
jgi:MFS family permease